MGTLVESMRRIMRIVENIDDEDEYDLDAEERKKKLSDLSRRVRFYGNSAEIEDNIVASLELLIKPPPLMHEDNWDDWEIERLSYWVGGGVVCVNFKEQPDDDGWDRYNRWINNLYNNDALCNRWLERLGRWISGQLGIEANDLYFTDFEPCDGNSMGVRLMSRSLAGTPLFDFGDEDMEFIKKIMK